MPQTCHDDDGDGDDDDQEEEVWEEVRQSQECLSSMPTLTDNKLFDDDGGGGGDGRVDIWCDQCNWQSCKFLSAA